METTAINLEPLANMLNLEGFTPNGYADFLDELAFNYAQTMIELQIADLTPKICLHEDSALFIHRLRELRDVMRKCSVAALNQYPYK
ncbi:hypothetical protein AGMMS49574_25650 [Bacteroidia bacterium]|nr:hypothetical protein AGMMS49574_25650 [Bacteroidia bacterium]